MIFTETSLPGAYIIKTDLHCDDRGSFRRIWCAGEFAAHGLNGELSQNSISTNMRCGTLRGLHYQHAPQLEDKLVICLQGRMFDVIADLRADSPTCGRWFSIELSGESDTALYIPKGIAHGFLTLEDDTHILYQISQPYDPALVAGIRWDDPTLSIDWPLQPSIISEKDRGLADFHQLGNTDSSDDDALGSI